MNCSECEYFEGYRNHDNNGLCHKFLIKIPEEMVNTDCVHGKEVCKDNGL